MSPRNTLLIETEDNYGRYVYRGRRTECSNSEADSEFGVSSFAASQPFSAQCASFGSTVRGRSLTHRIQLVILHEWLPLTRFHQKAGAVAETHSHHQVAAGGYQKGSNCFLCRGVAAIAAPLPVNEWFQAQ